MKKIISIIISILLIATVCSTFAITLAQNRSGGWGSVCKLSDSDKKWIEENYSQYNTVEDLLLAINNDICTQYTYVDKQYLLGLQHFDFSDFIKTKQGLCFDFSCFTKSVVLYISELKGWDIKVYVCDVILKNGGRHCYNFVVYEKDGQEVKYYTDMTTNLYQYIHSKEYTPYSYIFEENFEDYVAIWDEKIINYH